MRRVEESRALNRERATLKKQIQQLADQNAPEVLYFEQLLEALPPHVRIGLELRRLEGRLAELIDDEFDRPPC
jgi:hypothetical protein